MDEKTNVMRLLDQKKIKYNHYSYVDTPSTNGVEVAKLLGQDENRVFKTLVTVGKSKANYVFVIPVAKELNLKDLLPLTGYVHGGCSPIGMKKRFTTVLDETANDYENIIFSGGKIGYQVEMSPKDLEKFVPLSLAPLT